MLKCAANHYRPLMHCCLKAAMSVLWKPQKKKVDKPSLFKCINKTMSYFKILISATKTPCRASSCTNSRTATQLSESKNKVFTARTINVHVLFDKLDSTDSFLISVNEREQLSYFLWVFQTDKTAAAIHSRRLLPTTETKKLICFFSARPPVTKGTAVENLWAHHQRQCAANEPCLF